MKTREVEFELDGQEGQRGRRDMPDEERGRGSQGWELC